MLKNYLSYIKESIDDFERYILAYNRIPIAKWKASVIIKKILKADINVIYPFILEKDIDMNILESKNKLRFNDYMRELILEKEIRGHNFEGFIAGLYDGELSTIYRSRYDLIIPKWKSEQDKDKYNISIKFIKTKGESPVLSLLDISMTGNKKQKYTNMLDRIGIVEFFDNIPRAESKNILDYTFKDVDYFLLGYPNDPGSEDYSIKCVLIDKNEMIRRYIDGSSRVNPKNKKTYQVRVSTSIIEDDDIQWVIKYPIVSVEEFMIKDEEKAKEVFGQSLKYMRPDIVNAMMKHGELDTNKELFILDYKNFVNDITRKRQLEIPFPEG